MFTLLITADDFTGALDTGVKMAQSGAKTVVLTDADAPLESYADADVLVIDTETRHLSARQAGERVSRIVRRALELGVKCIYKKTDSALRANIGAELEAATLASKAKQLMFVPAFPQMKRTVVNGVLYIDGVPVSESVFGKDPFEPVRHSDIVSIIAEQSSVPVRLVKAGQPWDANAGGITVFDAADTAELEAVGEQLRRRHKTQVLAGCAGFASLLPELLGLRCESAVRAPKLSSRLLVICGSVNPITIAQLDKAEQNGFARVRLTPEQKLEPDYWDSPRGKRRLEEIAAVVAEKQFAIVETNDLGGNAPTSDYARSRSLTISEMRLRIADSIGRTAKYLIEAEAARPEAEASTLLITGGDVLMKAMQLLGISELHPICEMDTGVVLSRFECGGQKRYVLSKSGGFGPENQLLRIADKLKEADQQ